MFLYTFYLQLSLVTTCCYSVAYMGRWPDRPSHYNEWAYRKWQLRIMRSIDDPIQKIVFFLCTFCGSEKADAKP